jgi:hypothetical protein
MKSLHDRKLRIGHLAVALNENRNRLRLNLMKDSPIDVSAEAEGGWRGFSEYDLCHLSIVRKLVPYGVRLEEANKAASELIGDYLKTDAAHGNRPASVIDSVEQVLLAFWREGGELRASAYPRGFTGPLPDPCTLLLDPAGAIMSAFVRLYLLTDYVSADQGKREATAKAFIAELSARLRVPAKDLPFSEDVKNLEIMVRM